MSSILRTLQKRMMKKAGGLSRQKRRMDMIAGVPTVVMIPKGKRPIVDGAGEEVGMHWPKRFAMPTNPNARKKRPGPARGSRRGQMSKKFRAALQVSA